MDSATIREKFLAFFESKGHTRVPSASLLPAHDPTLLFVNAGMVPFKDYFLGAAQPPFRAATSSQCCIRAGGKHNDLEQVGVTPRHHTFFEMLGNFSFGAYFKKEAMEYAWEFLTKELGIDPQCLWVTVHISDDESAALWQEVIGIDPQRMSRCDEDNFWSMGDVGPCGPCTEIFYDHGEAFHGVPPGLPGEEGERYVEIWNLVFMQYNRDASGKLHPLPTPAVDTGMGLERISAVMQGVHDNYKTDLIQPFVQALLSQQTSPSNDEEIFARVVADHLRTIVFLLAEGLRPSNEGRGYVLRRIIRRAALKLQQLGMQLPALWPYAVLIIEKMETVYPQLRSQLSAMESALTEEELQFSKTLGSGMFLLNEIMDQSSGHSVLDGETVFKLYDTYGFPVDLTAVIAKEKGFAIDEKGFERALDAQRQRSRTQGHFKNALSALLPLEHSHFCGYTELSSESRVLQIFHEDQSVNSHDMQAEIWVVFDNSPCYAEAGGQVGDCALVYRKEISIGEVLDTQWHGQGRLHRVRLSPAAKLTVGDSLRILVDEKRRSSIARHHSATHLLHAALRATLGESVAQKGSWVGETGLRFDYSYDGKLDEEQLSAIEQWVNRAVLSNVVIETQLMSLEAAKALGAIGLFEDKYGEEVRVLRMGDWSMELCGGTHVARTGDIGWMHILQTSSVGSGVRRIEAIAGEAAQQWLASRLLDWSRTESLLGSSEVFEQVKSLQAHCRELEKAYEEVNTQWWMQQLSQVRLEKVNGREVLIWQGEGVNLKALHSWLDKMRDKHPNGLFLLFSQQDEKVSWAVGIGRHLVAVLNSKSLIALMNAHLGGRGGGREDFAQGAVELASYQSHFAAFRNALIMRLLR